MPNSNIPLNYITDMLGRDIDMVLGKGLNIRELETVAYRAGHLRTLLLGYVTMMTLIILISNGNINRGFMVTIKTMINNGVSLQDKEPFSHIWGNINVPRVSKPSFLISLHVSTIWAPPFQFRGHHFVQQSIYQYCTSQFNSIPLGRYCQIGFRARVTREPGHTMAAIPPANPQTAANKTP